MTTIFIVVKYNDAIDLRILLLFLENDEDFNRWIMIEERYIEVKLPDSCGDYKGPRMKRKSLFQ